MHHWSDTSQSITLLTIGALIWTLSFILIPTVATLNAVPTRMICLFVGAQISGIVLRFLQWPEMLGMLGFGVLFSNIGLANFDGYNEFEIFFRYLFVH